MNLEMHTFVTTVRYFSLRHSHLKNTQSQLQFRLKLAKEGNGAGGGGSALDKKKKKKKQSQTARVLTTQGAKQNCRVKKKNQTRHTHNTHTEGGNGRKHNLRL